jgi:magnesium transporter
MAEYNYNDSYPHGEHIEMVNNGNLLWINVENPNSEDLKSLALRYPFHELNLKDCLYEAQLSKVDKYEDHAFVLLHFPIIEKEISMPRSSQLSIFVGSDYLVTVHKGDLHPLTRMFDLCKNDSSQRLTLMGKSSGYLLYKIVDSLVYDLLHVLLKIERYLEHIKFEIFDERLSSSIARKISLMRVEIISLRSTFIPLNVVLLELTKEIQKFSTENLTPYFADVQDHINKVLKTLEDARDTTEVYNDTHFVLATEKSNKILAILTIFFTLSIPAATIAALYGMNVNLPGGGSVLSDGGFLGHHTTLILILIAITSPTLIMVWYFLKVGWIGSE